MFIKHGDGKIINIVNEETDLHKETSDKLLKLKNQFTKQLKDNLVNDNNNDD